MKFEKFKALNIKSLNKYKYVITILVFTIWMSFFDKHDLISSYKMQSQLNELKNQKNYYKKELENTKQLQKAIFEHNSNLEKYAREKFFMKKDNEQLYVIVEE